jgi:hypothetical protein
MGHNPPTESTRLRFFLFRTRKKKALEIDCILFSPFYVSFFFLNGYGDLAENKLSEKKVDLYKKKIPRVGKLTGNCTYSVPPVEQDTSYAVVLNLFCSVDP